MPLPGDRWTDAPQPSHKSEHQSKPTGRPTGHWLASGSDGDGEVSCTVSVVEVPHRFGNLTSSGSG